MPSLLAKGYKYAEKRRQLVPLANEDAKFDVNHSQVSDL